MTEAGDNFRDLPSVERVLTALDSGRSDIVIGAVRRAIDLARDAIRSGGSPQDLDTILVAVREILAEDVASRLQPVLNATGVLIHTNLGRVPLGEFQAEAISRVARSYSNLEYDLVAGSRGRRDDHARSLLRSITGAEDAIAVNNNAAAVLLVLAALCDDKEVIVSRGELIEIGGEFRIPDVIASSGATLVEVGTTNRTRIGDYEKAIGPDTGAILKVHPSNYRVVGFTAEVAAGELARLARGRGLLMIHDLGSGLVSPPDDWAGNEPEISVSVGEGADVVTFSGDKLLGGPQAGVIAGRTEAIERIGRHPLMRALRLDKLTLAALEATLQMHLEGRQRELPLWAMASVSIQELKTRGRALIAELRRTHPDIKVETVSTSAVTGGGSLPGLDLPSIAIAIDHPERSAAEIERSLRYTTPPVIARIEDDRVLLDLRTVPASSDEDLLSSLATVLG